MNVHFIAIGGAAMHNMAIAMKLAGHYVSGSDDEIFDPSKTRLENYGLLPEEFGWFPEKLNNTVDAVILGMHARKDNPELLRATELGIKVYSFPEFLYDHAKDKLRVVVGGSHGKTTITAMIMHVLKVMKRDFDYLVGSKIRDFDIMVKMSHDASVMVFEGDEYLSSPIDRRPKFHLYKPNIALLSGIAWDHINVFPTYQNYIEQFEKFIDLIEPGGILVYNETDETVREIIKNKTNVQLFPYNGVKYFVEDGKCHTIIDNEKIVLQVFGEHNMLNMDGARIVCNQLGVSDTDFFHAINSFKGTDNRLELIYGNSNGAIFKDFAHAPSKVVATVKAVREQFPDSTFVACLELHTYSSLNINFIDQYNGSMKYADRAAVYYNDHTIELKNLPDLSEEDVKDSFGRADLFVTTSHELLEKWLIDNNCHNIVYLFMSSGNFKGIDLNKLGKKLIGS